MAHFDDVIFPTDVTIGASSGGPDASTDVIITDSGFRKANQRWNQRLHRLNLKYGIRSASDVHDILEINQALNGRLDSGLARDWSDWNSTDGNMKPSATFTSTDQPLVDNAGNTTGNGSTLLFRMRKVYTQGGATHNRRVFKPQNGTVLIAIDGVTKTEGSGNDYTIDYGTGEVTFTVASTPGDALDVTWGGAFYIPVAFEDDFFPQSIDFNDIRSIPNIPLIEVKFKLTLNINISPPFANLALSTTAPVGPLVTFKMAPGAADLALTTTAFAMQINTTVPTADLTLTTTAPSRTEI